VLLFDCFALRGGQAGGSLCPFPAAAGLWQGERSQLGAAEGRSGVALRLPDHTGESGLRKGVVQSSG